MSDVGREPVVLRVDPGYTQPSELEMMALRVRRVEPELLLRDLETRQAMLDYAAQIGMSVVVSEPEDRQPGEYVARGLEQARQEQEARIAAAIPEILIPETVSYEEYSSEPYFPVLLKGQGASGGKDKYLIERPDQWQRFSTWAEGGKMRNADPADIERLGLMRRLLANLTQDKDIAGLWRAEVEHLEKYIKEYEYPMPDIMKNGLGKIFDYQRFIETPSDRYTSYRVLVTARGTILASSLYYSGVSKSNPEIVTTNGPIENLGLVGSSMMDFLTHPRSLVFLGAKKVLSNQRQGGSGIVLDPTDASKPMTDADKVILDAHGLDTQRPELPENIAEMSRTIGRLIGPGQGIVLGIDWLQEAETGEFYYLENNHGPGPVAYADAHMGGGHTDGADLFNARLEMEKAALRSLTD